MLCESNLVGDLYRMTSTDFSSLELRDFNYKPENEPLCRNDCSARRLKFYQTCGKKSISYPRTGDISQGSPITDLSRLPTSLSFHWLMPFPGLSVSEA